MIVFELICSGHHRFEGWFSSAEDFTSQKGRGMLECPTCSDKSIEKLLTAKIGHAAPVAPAAAVSDTAHSMPLASGKALQAKFQQFLDHVLTHSEDVGSAFAEEARKIHYEQVARRDIRGTATAEGAEELLDEGIPVLPLPIPRSGDWH